MGRSVSDNFKKRFGDPERIKVQYSKDKVSTSEGSYRNEQLSKAFVDVLRGVLGREPTHDEIIGKVDISKKVVEGETRKIERRK